MHQQARRASTRSRMAPVHALAPQATRGTPPAANSMHHGRAHNTRAHSRMPRVRGRATSLNVQQGYDALLRQQQLHDSLAIRRRERGQAKVVGLRGAGHRRERRLACTPHATRQHNIRHRVGEHQPTNAQRDRSAVGPVKQQRQPKRLQQYHHKSHSSSHSSSHSQPQQPPSPPPAQAAAATASPAPRRNGTEPSPQPTHGHLHADAPPASSWLRLLAMSCFTSSMHWWRKISSSVLFCSSAAYWLRTCRRFLRSVSSSRFKRRIMSLYRFSCG